MLSPDQVASQGPGGFLNLNGGPTDPYYAQADGSPYPSAAAACAAVPTAARRTRTVFVAGIGEMQWQPGDLSNAGLLPKGGTAAAGDTITGVALSAQSVLTITTDKGPKTVDLSALAVKGDTLTAVSLQGTVLQVVTDAGTYNVDLSSLQSSTGTAPVAGDTVSSLALSSATNLRLTTNQGVFNVDLSAFAGKGDTISAFSLTGDTLTLSTDLGTRTVSLAAYATKAYVTQQISAAAYTDEAAQDTVGNAVVDTQTVNLTYNDATGAITADLNYSDSAEIDFSQDANGLQAQLTPAVRAQLANAPTAAQKAALGASNNPGAGNRYVTASELAAAGAGAGSTPSALPTLTAQADGAQSFTLPAGISYVDALVVLEGGPRGGGVRALWVGDYSLSGTTLALAASALLRTGDQLSGTGFTAASAPPAQTSGGTYPADDTYPSSDTYPS